MSKRHNLSKAHSMDRSNTAVSVDPEVPNAIQDQIDSSYEEIQKRAYQIHEEKGGSDLENWLEAEKLLKEENHTGR